MWLIAGLGNPGKKYERNRHNVGFRVADELARRHGLGPLKEKFGGLHGTGIIAGQRASIIKPMKYMNLSGFAVSQAVQFQGVDPAQLVVVHDEIDLPFARLRLKSGGGHGGHNGVRSIMEQLGHGDFLRIRIGVGRPETGAHGVIPRDGVTRSGGDRSGGKTGEPGSGKVANHVLSDFPAEMDRDVAALVERTSDAVEAILSRGIRAAMNEFNGEADRPEKTKKAD